MKKHRIQIFLQYGLTVFLCLALTIWLLKLWKADLSIPFIYSGDSLFSGAMIKGMIQNGWYWHNPYVGMPFGLDFLDYPTADNLHFIVMKIISLFFPDYGTTMNLFYLLTFPLTAITSLYVFRHFKISFLPALLGSILYTFLPYHFFRSVGHLFLASYYMTPLMVMVILWVGSDKRSPMSADGEKKHSRHFKKNSYLWGPVVICLLVSSAGIYYSYFACFFLFVAGILASVKGKKLAPVLLAIVLIGVIGLGTIINVAPSVYHRFKYGKNPEIADRSFIGPELYGLKISQMLLPIEHHRLSSFSRFKENYNKHAPLVNENDWASLGFIGSIGFLILIAAIFFDRLRTWDAEINSLCYLNLAGTLLATIGGFSTLVAIFFPYIRGYNRVSIYLAFFGLFTISLVIEKLLEKYAEGRRKKFYIALFLFLGLGILDQTSPSFTHPYEGKKIVHAQQAEFIHKVESLMPFKAMIFQLPYFPFPENPPINKIQDYDHFGGGYLLSKELRWSYGAIKGREGDSWQKLVSAKSGEEFLEAIYLAGFQGLYIDRFGYEDQGVQLEKRLAEILAITPLVSANKRYAFYDLTEYGKRLKIRYSEREWEKRKEMAIYPLSLAWRGGFSGFEGTPENNWRWCSREGLVNFHNPSPRQRTVEIEMVLATGYEEYSEMNISGDLLYEKLKLNSQGLFFKRTIMIPPGRHAVKFKTDAKKVNAPRDPRTLVFRINNFRFKEIS